MTGRTGRTVNEENYYIYCVALNAPEGPLSGVTGHGGETVLGVRYKDLTAFVSRTPCTHIEVGFDSLQRHENVITELMRDYDLMPMSFSTICRSFEGVAGILERYYDQFQENFRCVAGKVELGVKVFCRLSPDEEEQPEASSFSSAKAFMLDRYERYRKKRLREQEILSPVESFHRELLRLASDYRAARPMKNSLIFNASYLVSKENKMEFDRKMEEIIAGNPSYKILYSGPWPAYHFVKIVREGEENE